MEPVKAERMETETEAEKDERQKRLQKNFEIYEALMRSTMADIAKKTKSRREREFILCDDTRISLGCIVWGLYRDRIRSCTKEMVKDIYSSWLRSSDAMDIRIKLMPY